MITKIKKTKYGWDERKDTQLNRRIQMTKSRKSYNHVAERQSLGN